MQYKPRKVFLSIGILFVLIGSIPVISLFYSQEVLYARIIITAIFFLFAAISLLIFFNSYITLRDDYFEFRSFLGRSYSQTYSTVTSARINVYRTLIIESRQGDLAIPDFFTNRDRLVVNVVGKLSKEVVSDELLSIYSKTYYLYLDNFEN